MNVELKLRFYPDNRNMPEGDYSIKLVVNYHKRVYIPTNIILSLEKWNVVQRRSIQKDSKTGLTKENLTEIRSKLDEAESKVIRIHEKLSKQGIPFTAIEIKNQYETFKTKSYARLSLVNLYDELIEIKKKNNQPYRTISSYISSKNAILNFYITKHMIENGITILKVDKQEKLIRNFKITEIDPSFLNSFEILSTKSNKESKYRHLSISSVQSYLLNLRAVFNYAISENLVEKSSYPFRNNENKTKPSSPFPIKKSQMSKKLLFDFELDKIFSVRNELTDPQKNALDFFALSMILGGANYIDIALLKKTDYNESLMQVNLRRRKTSRTSKEIKNKIVNIDVLGHSIIETYKDQDSKFELLFDILKGIDLLDDKKVIDVINSKTKLLGKKYEIIAKKADIKKKFTFAYARHSLASKLKKEGVPIEDISDVLQHADVETTKIYITTIPTNENEIDKIKADIFKSYNNVK